MANQLKDLPLSKEEKMKPYKFKFNYLILKNH